MKRETLKEIGESALVALGVLTVALLAIGVIATVARIATSKPTPPVPSCGCTLTAYPHPTISGATTWRQEGPGCPAVQMRSGDPKITHWIGGTP